VAGLPLQLVVGLGNPGPEHEHTRHNAGFWFVEELARRHDGRLKAERLSVSGTRDWSMKTRATTRVSGSSTNWRGGTTRA